MAADEKAEKKPEAQGPKKSKMKLIVPLVLALVNLGVCGAGLYLVYSSTLGWEKPAITEVDSMAELEEKEKVISSHPIIYRMDPFVVNLDGKPLKSIRLEVNLELLDEGGFEEVASLGAEARDSIVRLLNSTRYDQIESIQGKLFLKDSIMVALNDILIHGVVKDIFFSDFLVQ